MTCWTYGWAAETVRRVEAAAARGSTPPLDHLASGLFLARGVLPGDLVYVVALQDGRVRLLGRVEVGEVVGQEEARRRLGYEPWPAPDHVLAAPGTAGACRLDVTLRPAEALALRFLRPDGSETPPAQDRHGGIDRQTLRGCRRLTDASARRLDALLAGRSGPGVGGS